jgi:hypothetical protein
LAAGGVTLSITRQDFGTGRMYEIELPAQTVSLPSVTNILGILGKPALPNWAAKVTREGVAQLVREGASQGAMSDQQQIADLLKSNGLGHNQQRDSAAERGTGVHEFAQAIADGHDVTPINPYCKAFLSWWKKENPVVSFTEMTVYSVADGYAGTADLGTTTHLWDFKTAANPSRKAYESDYLQTAAYRRALRQMTGANLGTGVLVLRENGTYEPFYSPDPDKDEQAFLNLLAVWRWRVERGFR